jgi:uncharacterized protein YggU (UPF0235/DUF167 family)
LHPQLLTPWHAKADGVMLTIRLTPKAAHNGVDGMETLADGRCVLKVRLRAAPHEGEANAALCRFIADLCALAPRAISLRHGGKSRIKLLHIAGDPAAILNALTAQLSSHTKG